VTRVIAGNACAGHAINVVMATNIFIGAWLLCLDVWKKKLSFQRKRSEHNSATLQGLLSILRLHKTKNGSPNSLKNISCIDILHKSTKTQPTPVNLPDARETDTRAPDTIAPRAQAIHRRRDWWCEYAYYPCTDEFPPGRYRCATRGRELETRRVAPQMPLLA